jgi:hypothetical protein
MYLFLAVVVAGGLGVWVELKNVIIGGTNDYSNLLLAIYTYFPAIAAAPVLQLVLREEKYVRSFGLIIGSVLLILGVTTFPDTNSGPSLFLICVPASVVAVLFWWIANGTDPNFDDKVHPEDSLGGSTESEPTGNTAGFKL